MTPEERANTTRLHSALYADLFYTNQGALEFRRDHLEVWVLMRLALEGPSTGESIRRTFETAYPGCVLDEPTLHATLEHLEQLGQVHRPNEKDILATPNAIKEVRSAEARYGASRASFFEGVAAHIEEVSGSALSAAERDAVTHCTEQMIISGLLEERGSLERLYLKTDDLGFLSSRRQERDSQLMDCLGTQMKDSLSTRRLELRKGIFASLSDLRHGGFPYLHTLHRSVIGSFFLIKDPHHVENVRAVVQGRTYFLDTNVYLAWLYRSQSAHRIVKSVLDLMRDYGVRLCILPQTVEEIRHVEADAHRAINQASRDATRADYLRRTPKAISTDFLMAQSNDKNLTLAIWEKMYTGVEKLLGAYGIETMKIDISESGFDRDLSTFRNAVKGCKEDAKRLVREEAIDHDAFALLALASMQLAGDRDAWGSKVRFLSLDSTLTAAVGELRNALGKRYDAPDSPFALARIVVPSAAHELKREAYEEYVISAIQQDLGVLTEMRGYTELYLIDKLDQAGLPVRTILEAPAHAVESVLAELQGRKGLGKRLDQVLAIADTDERALLVGELGREIADAIAFRSELVVETERQLVEERELRRRHEDLQVSLEMKVTLLSDRIALQDIQIENGIKTLATTAATEKELSSRNSRLTSVLIVTVTLLIMVVTAFVVFILFRQ